MDRVAESYDHTLRELVAEKAAALARIASTLDALVGDLRILREQIRSAALEERGALVARYQSAREQALLYRWYLEVQREAVGFCRHETLDGLYPIPAPIRD